MWVVGSVRFSIFHHYLERTFEVRNLRVLKLSLNVLEILFFLGLIPIFGFDPFFRRSVLKSIGIDLIDCSLKEDVWLHCEKCSELRVWSELGGKVSFQKCIDDVRFGSEVPHELLNSLVLWINNRISSFDSLLLSWGFILRIFIHDLLKRREKLDVLRGPIKSVRVCFTFAIPSLSVAFDMGTELHDYMISENIKDLKIVSVCVK